MRNIQITSSGHMMDIDGDTALGVTYKGFSFDDAGSISLSYTNSFSVPLTKNNRKIFSFPDNMHLNAGIVNNTYYGKLDVKVYSEGQFLFGGKCHIESVSDERINMYLVNSRDFIDVFSEKTMFDASELAAGKINEELARNYPSGASFSEIIGFAASGNSNIWMPYAIGTLSKQYPGLQVKDGIESLVNLYDSDPNSSLEDETKVCTEFITDSEVEGDYKSGHFFVNVKFLIDTILSEIGFTTEWSQYLGENLSKDFVNTPDITVYKDLVTNAYSFRADSSYKMSISDKSGSSKSKNINLLDFFKSVMQEWACAFIVEGDKVSFKSLHDIGKEASNSLKLSKVVSRRFTFDNLLQKSWIGYHSVKGDGSDASNAGGLEIICLNRNIGKGSSDSIAFSIKRAIVGYFTYLYDDGQVSEITRALDLTDTKTSEEIVIVRKDNSSTGYDIKVSRYFLGAEDYTQAHLVRCVQSTVGTNGAWTLYKDSCLNPEEIEAEVMLKPHIVRSLKPWSLTSLEGVPGLWYITEINGFNPRLESSLVNLKAVRIR